jgi:hypothetical protein
MQWTPSSMKPEKERAFMSHSINQKQIDGIVRRHLPRGWKLRIAFSGLTRYWAYAHAERKEIVMDLPVTNRWWLQLFLHEVGHVRIKHHKDNPPAHVEEYEAELYAIHVMRHEGVPVLRAGLARAKINVCRRILEDEAKDIPILPHIYRWAHR